MEKSSVPSVKNSAPPACRQAGLWLKIKCKYLKPRSTQRDTEKKQCELFLCSL